MVSQDSSASDYLLGAQQCCYSRSCRSDVAPFVAFTVGRGSVGFFWLRGSESPHWAWRLLLLWLLQLLQPPGLLLVVKHKGLH